MKMNKSFLLLALTFMLPAIIVGFLIGSVPGYQTYNYVWKDANFCLSCHVHDYATNSWQDSSHGKMTTCHDCHHQPLHKYIQEGVIQVLQRPKFPEDLHHTPYVPSDLCQTCHVSTVHDKSTLTGPLAKESLEHLPKVDKMYLHRLHLKKETDLALLKSHTFSKEERMGQFKEPTRLKGEKRLITCSDCHGGPTNRAHNFTAVDISCVRCHNDVHESQVGKKYGCRSCHFQEFLLGVDASTWVEKWQKTPKVKGQERQ